MIKSYPFKIGFAAQPIRYWLIFGLLALAFTAEGSVLWRSPEARLIHDNGSGVDILHGVIPPENATSGDTLYFKFRVTPLSDYSTESEKRHYLAGLVFYEGKRERLGVGNAMIARAYSAFNTSETGPGNHTSNEYDLNSKAGDPSIRGRTVEVPRKDVPRTILFKVQYIPDSDALVTVWLNPDLSPRSSETSQSPDITTRFKANALFNELHLCHLGSGDGWWFSDLAIATSFSDFVTPHIWERAWFISMTTFALLTAFGCVIWQVDRNRRQRFEREQERWDALHAVERERTRIARDIHDDLGATLSEIRLLSKFAQVPDSPLERIREDMKQIAAKALNSTQALDEIVWAVDPEADTIESFVNYACTFATEYLALADMRCRLDLPTRPPAIYLRADVRHNLFLAFKESITNIIKHASASEVCVKMEIADKTFTVTVSDNGIGMPPEILSAANRSETPGQDGLANMKSRLLSIGGQYEICSPPGQGTTVWLQIALPAS